MTYDVDDSVFNKSGLIVVSSTYSKTYISLSPQQQQHCTTNSFEHTLHRMHYKFWTHDTDMISECVGSIIIFSWKTN